MKRPDLRLNTAMRLAMRYAALNALLFTAALGVLYLATTRYVNVQLEAALRQEASRLLEIDNSQGRQALLDAIRDSAGSARPGRLRFYLVVDARDNKIGGDFPRWPEALEANSRVRTVWMEADLVPPLAHVDDAIWPMIGAALVDGGKLLIAQRVDEAEDLQEFTLSVMGMILLLAVAATLLMGWMLGRGMRARIDVINSTARAVMHGDMSRRVPVSLRHDEFDELAQHLNSMLARIEQLLQAMRQVSDDIAHDLRTPLSRLRNRLEVCLLEQRDSADYRAAMSDAINDAQQLIGTFNALLHIAQAEGASPKGTWQDVGLSALLDDLAELYAGVAEEQGKQFRARIPPDLQLRGDRQLLAQLFTNLLDNALKYTGASGVIELDARDDNTGWIVCVSDNGPGIPAGERDFVLRRFARLEVARSSPGAGLGLSLVKAVADLHGLELRLEDNNPGLRVCVSNAAA